MVKTAKARKNPSVRIPKLELTYAHLGELVVFPWRWASSSVEEFTCTDVLHYVPARSRGRFMDELHRVLVTGAQATIVCAYYSTALAYSDYAMEWPPLCEQSFLYFNREWREANGLHKELECDFDFVYGYILTPEVATKSSEAQTFQVKSYLNAVQRLQIVLTKREKKA